MLNKNIKVFYFCINRTKCYFEAKNIIIKSSKETVGLDSINGKENENEFCKT